MPERLILGPEKSKGASLETDPLLKLEKFEVVKTDSSFLNLYNYASLFDYSLIPIGVSLTILFSFLQVKFIGSIGDFIEIAGTYRFDLPKYYDEQHLVGLRLLELGFMILIICWISLLVVSRLGSNVQRRWKSAYFLSVIHKPVAWHEKNFNSYTTENMEKDCLLIQTAVGEKPLLIIFAASFYICCWVHSASIHYGLTLVASVMVPFQLIAAFVLERASVKNPSEAHEEALPVVNETVSSMKSIRNSNLEGNSESIYNEKVGKMTTRTTVMGSLHGFGWAMSFVVLYSFSAGLFYMISQILLKEPDWWIGDTVIMPREAVEIFIATSMSSFYLGWIAPSIRHIYRGKEAAGRLELVIKKNEKEDGFKRVLQIDGKVEFNRVVYKGLDRVNFTVEPGEKIGILGGKGTGKSIIGELVAGIRYCESGDVLIDGADIKQLVIGDVREFVVLVGQKPVIFPGSFRDNISLGILCTDNDVEKAAKIAGVHECILSFGGYLSSVPVLNRLQQQQISLARAMLRNPKVLVIDDILSGVPYTSQEVLIKDLQNCCNGKTCIILTKKPSLLYGVTDIVILDSGAVSDSVLLSEIANHPEYLKLNIVEKALVSVPEPQKNENVISDFSYSDIICRITRSEAKYWPWLIVVVLSGIVAGITFPIFGYFFADNVATLLYLHGAFDKSKIKEDMKDRIVESILILITITLLCGSLGRIAALHTRDIREKLMKALLCSPIENFKSDLYGKENIGKALGDDSEKLGNLAGATVGILILISSAIAGTMYYAIISDTTLAIIVASVVPLIIGITLCAEAVIASTVTPYIPTSDKTLENTKLIQSYNRENYYHDEYIEVSMKADEKAERLGYISAFFIGGKFLILFGFWGIIGFYSASNVKDGDLALDDMFVVTFCMLFCFSSFLVVAALMPNIPKSLASAKNILTIIDSAQAIPVVLYGKKIDSQGLIEFKNVSFVYQGLSDYAVLDLSFQLSPGGLLTILGSGEVIADLLLRHCNVDSGEILIDGIGISQYDVKSIRDNIGYISKSPLIFEGDLKKTLDPLKKSSESETTEMIEKFGLKESVWSETDKANIEIARCLLKKPKVIIAHEYSAALKGPWSLILLSSLIKQGEIILLEQGVVVEQGSHSKLLKKPNGVYKVQTQLAN